MKLPSYFKEFLGEIEPSPSYKEDQKAGHATLRRRLASDDQFGPIHVNTFLQGSYKRNTAIHPGKDVDIVVVTSLDPAKVTPSEANAFLGKCLRKYYEKVDPQTRSFAVTLSYVSMDVVLATSHLISADPTLQKSFSKIDGLELATGWTEHPLLIPDRDLGRWVETDPKRQLAWTTELNEACGGYFVPLVKLLKWWRLECYERPKNPKGYVLERLAGDCVDRSVRDHAEGFLSLLQNLYRAYSGYVSARGVPNLPDPGVPSHNVAQRLSSEDFAVFMEKVTQAMPVARAALEEPDTKKSADLWRKLFGAKFPAAPDTRATFPPTPVRPNKPSGFAE